MMSTAAAKRQLVRMSLLTFQVSSEATTCTELRPLSVSACFSVCTCQFITAIVAQVSFTLTESLHPSRSVSQKYSTCCLWNRLQLECGPMPNVMATLPNRWRPLFNAARFGWCPLLECRAVTLPRRKTRWNLQGCPKLANRSQLLVGRSSPYYHDMWRRYCCLTSFFSIVDKCLSSEDIARQSCVIVSKWWFFASCISSEPRAAHFRPAF